MQSISPPLQFVLIGTPRTIVYELGAFARTWEAAEIKSSDRVKVLTFADEDMCAWQASTLKQLAVPARYGGIVLAREHVDVPLGSLVALSAWTCTHLSKLGCCHC